MGNSPQVKSTICTTDRMRRHGQGTCRQVHGTQALIARTSTGKGRARKGNIIAHRGLCQHLPFGFTPAVTYLLQRAWILLGVVSTSLHWILLDASPQGHTRARHLRRVVLCKKYVGWLMAHQHLAPPSSSDHVVHGLRPL